jgi:hypothetical protein
MQHNAKRRPLATDGASRVDLLGSNIDHLNSQTSARAQAVPVHPAAQNGGPPMNYTDYLLAELRCAALRARILASDVDAIGLALKNGLVTPDQAVDLMADSGVLQFVVPTPPKSAEAV